jgi:hypothetical protein
MPVEVGATDAPCVVKSMGMEDIVVFQVVFWGSKGLKMQILGVESRCVSLSKDVMHTVLRHLFYVAFDRDRRTNQMLVNVMLSYPLP